MGLNGREAILNWLAHNIPANLPQKVPHLSGIQKPCLCFFCNIKMIRRLGKFYNPGSGVPHLCIKLKIHYSESVD